ncbi:hypothetical protein [Thermogemmatispora carboxidivorans]|uniref:hypothetical protein n=1 Tax=Thermogemmatispora carboxidivorans TaxID=1382306 RepID=UPI001EE21E57|nr:hypothetical protein [Thermogemmatispora carboxidivorans]
MKALRDLTHELAIDQAIRAIDSRTTLRIALSHDDGQYDREQLKTMLQYGYLHEVEGITSSTDMTKIARGPLTLFAPPMPAGGRLPFCLGEREPPILPILDCSSSSKSWPKKVCLRPSTWPFVWGLLASWESATPKCGLT